jgi:hypothetical protein
MRTKYIVLDARHAIIFGEEITHAEAACAFKGYGKPTSAGFVQIDDQGTYPYGESISLKLKQDHDKDKFLLNRTLGLSQ